MQFTPVKDFDKYKAGQTYTEDDAKVQPWIDSGKVREVTGAKAGQRGAVGATRDSVTGADSNDGPRDSVTGQPAKPAQDPKKR